MQCNLPGKFRERRTSPRSLRSIVSIVPGRSCVVGRWVGNAVPGTLWISARVEPIARDLATVFVFPGFGVMVRASRAHHVRSTSESVFPVRHVREAFWWNAQGSMCNRSAALRGDLEFLRTHAAQRGGKAMVRGFAHRVCLVGLGVRAVTVVASPVSGWMFDKR